MAKYRGSLRAWWVIPLLFICLSVQAGSKLIDNENYSIQSNYLGTPEVMYDAEGKVVWSAELDAYGDVQNLTGERTDCPFRYYSAEEGMYVCQDPIGIWGGIKFYGYVHNVNNLIDVLGLKGCPDRDIDEICKKYGGIKTGDKRYKFEGPGAKKRAKQAASEISGDLGSNPRTIRRKDYIDNNTYRNSNSNRVIGKHSSAVNSNNQPVAGYHDHEIGHSNFDAPKHFNAWSESTGSTEKDNVHLYY